MQDILDRVSGFADTEESIRIIIHETFLNEMRRIRRMVPGRI